MQIDTKNPAWSPPHDLAVGLFGYTAVSVRSVGRYGGLVVDGSRLVVIRLVVGLVVSWLVVTQQKKKSCCYVNKV